MTNYAKNARAQGWDMYCIEMVRLPVHADAQPSAQKETTQNCYVTSGSDPHSMLVCWGDVLGTISFDEWGNWLHINTKRARYEILEAHWGHARIQRGPDAVERFERVSKGGPMSKFRSNVEEAQYHYFNKNGAYVAHRDMYETLMQYVDAGHINSGWLLGHDSSWEKQHLEDAAQKKRSPSVRYYIERIYENIEETYTMIGEVHLGLRDRAGKLVEEK